MTSEAAESVVNLAPLFADHNATVRDDELLR
jgi:hypothetical protein